MRILGRLRRDGFDRNLSLPPVKMNRVRNFSAAQEPPIYRLYQAVSNRISRDEYPGFKVPVAKALVEKAGGVFLLRVGLLAVGV